MIQAKFSIQEDHHQLLQRFKDYGFKDKSAMLRAALDAFGQSLEDQMLRASAELYAELYEKDLEGREWTDDALHDWPE
jgi:hypothetical protein